MAAAAIAVGGAILQSRAASKAAKASRKAGELQAGAADAEIEERRRQFDLVRSDLAPYRGAGPGALAQYQALLGLGGSGSGSFSSNKSSQQIRQELIDSGDFDNQGDFSGFDSLRDSRGNRVRDIGFFRNFRPEGSTGNLGGGIYQRGSTVFAPAGVTEDDLTQSQADALNDDDVAGYGLINYGTTSLDESRLDEELQRRLSANTGGETGQQADINSLLETPGQRFIRARAQKNLLRNSGAIGGLGGGNVRSALVQQGTGFAAQDLENRFARLQPLITGGQNASVQTGGFGAQQASGIGQALQSGAQARAGGVLGAQQARAQGTSGLLNAAGAIFGSGGFGGGGGGGSSPFSANTQSINQAFAPGGLVSDKRLKKNVKDLDLEGCYESVISMPLKSWQYLDDLGLAEGTHLGPMAQEAPDMIREMGPVEMLNLHSELMMIAGALQYLQNIGKPTCH